jgi:hypothetical protein
MIAVVVAIMIVVARIAGIATHAKTANTTMNQTAISYQLTLILITQKIITNKTLTLGTLSFRMYPP